MGVATERRLATMRKGPHDLSTVRALPTITSSYDVSDSQILDVATAAPLRLVKPVPRGPGPTLSDLATQSFFEDGARGELTGTYAETEHVRIRSLDEVPRRLGPRLIVLSLMVAAAGAAGWWLGANAFATLGLII
jgi:hypothetical protein